MIFQVFDNESDVNFSWPKYLSETGSKSAPTYCFRQSTDPPRNEFEKGDKLEVLVDQWSQSVCVATVVSKMGSRVRLRLDGTDSKNDFWKMVDSGDLQEFGHCESRGSMLQPPGQ